MILIESITFKTAKLEGGKLIIDIPQEHRWSVMNFIRNMKDRMYQLDIKLFQKKRSNNANRYFWELIGKIASDRHLSPVEVYREYIPDVGDNYTFSTVKDDEVDKFIKAWGREGLGWIAEVMGPSNEPEKTDIICYYGSSFFSVQQMSRLLDLAIQDCRELGIETRPKEEIDSLLSAWQ